MSGSTESLHEVAAQLMGLLGHSCLFAGTLRKIAPGGEWRATFTDKVFQSAILAPRGRV